MSLPAGIDAGEAPSEARSPWRDARDRLVRDPLAIAALVVVTLMVLGAALAPWVAPDDPSELHPWIGAQAPGYRRPDCHGMNALKVGAGVEGPDSWQRSPSLQIIARDRAPGAQGGGDWRIVCRNGRISLIAQGPDSVQELDLSHPARTAWEIAEDGGRQRRLPSADLKVGRRPPQGWFTAGTRVEIVRLERASAATVVYDVDIAQGIVRGLRRDHLPIQQVSLPGESVVSVTGDGHRLEIDDILGTDLLGRDLLSRILYGGRISLMVGLVATAVSLVIGVLYGAVAGYAGGALDQAMMAVVDILFAIPFLFLVILLLVVFNRSLIMLFAALGAVQWLTMARIVRAQVMSLRRREFVAAALVGGASHWRIITRHLIPNTLGTVIVYTTLTIPSVILQESFLAFIGLTVQYHGQDLASWGALVKDGMAALDDTNGARSWLLVWPSVAMCLTLLALNCLGSSLRDALDPRGVDHG